jgi:hypothetical protein
MSQRSPIEIEIPGNQVLLPIAHEAEEVGQLLGLVSEVFGDASIALILYENVSRSAASHDQSRDRGDRDRNLLMSAMAQVEAELVQSGQAGMGRNAMLHEAQRRILRTKVANGILPGSLQHKVPFLYAKAFLNAADAIGRMIAVIEKYSTAPAAMKGASSRYYASFPDLRGVRNTTQHLEDRGRGLGERGRPMQPVQATSGPVMIRGLAIDVLINNRFGSTLADGTYGEVEISAASLATIRDHIETVLQLFQWKGNPRVEPL